MDEPLIKNVTWEPNTYENVATSIDVCLLKCWIFDKKKQWYLWQRFPLRKCYESELSNIFRGGVNPTFIELRTMPSEYS